MWDKVGVFRNESNLRFALKELGTLREDLGRQSPWLKSKRYNQELVEGLENYFLTTVAQCVTEAALLRTESRGAHYREDHPKTDHLNWLQHLLIRQSNGKLQIEKIPTDLAEVKPDGGAV